MEKLFKTLKSTKVTFIISLFSAIIFSSTVFAQSGEKVAANDATISASKNVIEQTAGVAKTNTVSKNSLSNLPKFGPELQEIAGSLLQYLVLDAEAAKIDSANSSNQNDNLGFALTSSFINNQLMDGMRLELHANPLNGGGSIRFKKVF